MEIELIKGRDDDGGLEQQIPAVLCEADKRRTDTSDIPVSVWVERGADTAVEGPPEMMIEEMAEGGSGRACCSSCDCYHHQRASFTLKGDKIDDGRRSRTRSCRAGQTRGGLIGVINP